MAAADGSNLRPDRRFVSIQAATAWPEQRATSSHPHVAYGLIAAALRCEVRGTCAKGTEGGHASCERTNWRGGLEGRHKRMTSAAFLVLCYSTPGGQLNGPKLAWSHARREQAPTPRSRSRLSLSSLPECPGPLPVQRRWQWLQVMASLSLARRLRGPCSALDPSAPPCSGSDSLDANILTGSSSRRSRRRP